MKTRLRKLAIRGTVAAVAATAVAVPVAPRPAQAVDPTTILGIAQFAAAAFSLYQSSQTGGLTLEQAVSRMITEVHRSEIAITAHLDSLAVAEVRGCTEHALLEFVESPDFPLSLRQRFAQDTTGCVTQINTRFDAVAAQNHPAKNDLGALLGMLGPVALAARAQANLQTAELKQYLIDAFIKIKNHFTPTCSSWPDLNTAPVPAEEVWMHYYELWLYGWFQCSGPTSQFMFPYDVAAYRYQAALWRLGTFAGVWDPANGRMVEYYPHWQQIFDEAGRRTVYIVATESLGRLQS
jgi:hypothetical protein